MKTKLLKPKNVAILVIFWNILSHKEYDFLVKELFSSYFFRRRDKSSNVSSNSKGERVSWILGSWHNL